MKKFIQFNNYQEIPNEYKWDLDSILENHSFDYWLNLYEDLFKKRIAIKDFKYKDFETYLQDCKLNDELTEVFFKLHNYVSNNLNTDLTNPFWIELNSRLSSLNNKLSLEFGSEKNRFFANIEIMKEWKNDPRLSIYKKDIENLIESEKHQLSKEVEEYLLTQIPLNNRAQKIFSLLTNGELDFHDVVLDNGKKAALNAITYKKLLKNPSAKVRKQAYQNFANAYLKHKGVLSELLYQNFKEYQLEAKLRNYSNTIEFLTFEDRFNEELLLNLYSKVIQNSTKLNKYFKYKKKFYKLRYKNAAQKWDGARELLEVKSSYTIEEAKNIVKEALKPLGKEYNDQIEQALNEKWVDFLSAKTKRGGAYSIGASYGIKKKHILMNFAGDLRSVGTLAHELGHSMHSYFSDKTQTINNSQYPIFLAEIASVFNELMLYDYLLTHTTDKKARFVLLDNLITNFINTIVKQTEWSNYEYAFLKALENDLPMNNWQAISQLYYENHLKYTYDKKTKYHEQDLILSFQVETL
ncbi:M3 family metallopeptidase [Mycoplasmopsis gallopavonis]|uniref:Oligoendopeptidase F, plasmid n=1 Tax=Mycoplasmopsis gallopavonis TaxID=76629 RepID=A0A449AYM5_9BACT|nr:M3 family metallopeptidase [Mycoplasmopsis gallopavonis]RIV16220.1 oligoendopeptidase F [Mycoplasmopsis gallopavonis]VEU72592.1 Oligoendopeptidase F, plasmid [Mycoplasmopsis gallopavonis]